MELGVEIEINKAKNLCRNFLGTYLHSYSVIHITSWQHVDTESKV